MSTFRIQGFYWLENIFKLPHENLCFRICVSDEMIYYYLLNVPKITSVKPQDFGSSCFVMIVYKKTKQMVIYWLKKII